MNELTSFRSESVSYSILYSWYLLQRLAFNIMSRLFGCHLQEAFPDHPSKTGLSTVSSVLFPFLVAASLAYLLLSILPT